MAQTRDQIQLMFGRLVDWQATNPLLLPGEVACVFDNETMKPIDLKFGNGIARFNELPSLVNNDIVYTKEETNILLKSISDRVAQLTSDSTLAAGKIQILETVTIPGIQALLDTEATSENRLAALSTVIREIRNSINARFGRLVTFTPTGAPFLDLESLAVGPWYVDGEEVQEIKEGDNASVDGYDYSFKYTGVQWKPDTQAMILTDEQKAALNSGVTEEVVAQVPETRELLDKTVEDLGELSGKVADDSTKLENLSDSAARYVSAYKNVAKVISSGAGYSLYEKVTVGTAIKGFVTEVTKQGNLVSVFLLDTENDISTEEPLGIYSKGGSGATCTVESSALVYGLRELDRYHRQLTEIYSNYNLPRGESDDKLKLVRNGNLTAIFIPETLKYVDASYTGAEEGLEFAPYRTGQSALASFTSDQSGTIMYSAGAYPETLAFEGKLRKAAVGYAIGSRCSTSIERVTIDRNSENIGLRDLKINTYFEIANGRLIYGDNLTVDGRAEIISGDVAYFTHCTFNGSVNVGAGTVEFDCCSFGKNSELIVRAGATVIIRACTDVHPNIQTRGTYLHISGSLSPQEGQTFALVASTGATFVGLFNGVALNAVNDYAPISISASVKYALGTFLCDLSKSQLPLDTYRQAYDGLNSRQVYVGAKQGDEEGYETTSPYLNAHLSQISAVLKFVSDRIVDGAIDRVELEGGTLPGSVTLVCYKGKTEVSTSKDVIVTGLKSAAFTDTTDYATAAQGQVAESAYQLPTGGVPEAHLAEAVRTKLNEAEKVANKTTEISASSTDDQYPTAKSVYTGIRIKLDELLTRVPTKEGNSEVNNMLVTEKRVKELASGYGRSLTATSTSTGNAGAFASFGDLTRADVFWYGQKQIYRSKGELQEADKASYFRFTVVTDGGETKSYDTVQALWEAVYQGSKELESLQEGIDYLKVLSVANFTGDTWGWYTDSATNLGVDEFAALTSRVTLELVKVLNGSEDGYYHEADGKSIIDFWKEGKSLKEVIEGKQDRIPAGANGDLLTYSGTAGTLGSARKVVSDIDTGKDTSEKWYTEDVATTYKGNDRDIPSARAVSNQVDRVTKQITKELAKKENNLPRARVGANAPVHWWMVSDSGTDILTDKELGDKIKPILDAGGGYYRKITDAEKSYVPYDATKPNNAIIANGGVEGGKVKPEYYTPVNSVSETPVDDKKLPTVGAVYSKIKEFDDAHREEVEAKLAEKQNNLGVGITEAQLVAASNGTGKGQVTYKPIQDIAEAEEFTDSTSLANDAIPTVRTVLKIRKSLKSEHDKDLLRVFREQRADEDDVTYKGLFSEKLPVYELSSEGEPRLVPSNISADSLVSVFDYGSLNSLANLVKSYTTYVPGSFVPGDLDSALAEKKLPGIEANDTFYGLKFIPPQKEISVANSSRKERGAYLALPSMTESNLITFVSSDVYLYATSAYYIKAVDSTVHIFSAAGQDSLVKGHIKAINSKIIIHKMVQSVNMYKEVYIDDGSIDSEIVLDGYVKLVSLSTEACSNLNISILGHSTISLSSAQKGMKVNSTIRVLFDTDVQDSIAIDGLPFVCTKKDADGTEYPYTNGNSRFAGRAFKADKLTWYNGSTASTTAGSSTVPVYFSGGIPKPVTFSVEDPDNASIKLMKMSSGCFMTVTKSVGASNLPVYVDEGVIRSVDNAESGNIAITARGARKLVNSSGAGFVTSEGKLIRFNGGVPEETALGGSDGSILVRNSSGGITNRANLGNSTTPIYLATNGVPYAGCSYVSKDGGEFRGSLSIIPYNSNTITANAKRVVIGPLSWHACFAYAMSNTVYFGVPVNIATEGLSNVFLYGCRIVIPGSSYGTNLAGVSIIGGDVYLGTCSTTISIGSIRGANIFYVPGYNEGSIAVRNLQDCNIQSNMAIYVGIGFNKGIMTGNRLSVPGTKARVNGSYGAVFGNYDEDSDTIF